MEQNFDQIQRGVTTYLSTLKTVVQGITQSVAGKVIGGAGAQAGMVVTFFVMMAQGIAEAEMAKKMQDKLMQLQHENIQGLFEFNQQQEQIAQEVIRNEIRANKAEAENNINNALYLHIGLAIGAVLLVLLLLFVFFPRKK